MSHVHNTWKCGHARRPYNGLSKATREELRHLAEHGTSLTWRDAAHDELRERSRFCPACRDANRRAFRRGLLLTLFAIVLLVVTCSARGNVCAPYTPADGKTCEPPAKLAAWNGVPVCLCPASGLAHTHRKAER